MLDLSSYNIIVIVTITVVTVLPFLFSIYPSFASYSVVVHPHPHYFIVTGTETERGC